MPLIFVILNLLFWIIGIQATLHSAGKATPKFIEKFIAEAKIPENAKKLLYPILETATMYTCSMGVIFLVPFIYYYKGKIDGYYISYALNGAVPLEFVVLYLLVLIPASLAVYYGTRLFVALLLDLFDIKDKHIEIKRSVYGFLVCMLVATVIGIVLTVTV
ncbi:MAG: hypothetical protein GXO42_02730 [bacterium]|nr:hypothetical protein [bacterium]